MTKPIIVVKVPCKLLYVIQVKGFLIKCSTSWPYLISEFLVAYITIVASDWPHTIFTPKVFLFSIRLTGNIRPKVCADFLDLYNPTSLHKLNYHIRIHTTFVGYISNEIPQYKMV